MDKTVPRQLAKRVTSLMEQRAINQVDLAKAMGRSQPLVSQFLGGTRSVSLETLSLIASALRVELADLFPRSGDTAVISLTDVEAAVVTAYRRADPKSRNAVMALLDVSREQLGSPGTNYAGPDIDQLAGSIAEFINSVVVSRPPGSKASAGT